MAIKIDTGKVVETANQIATYNKKIRDDFQEVKDAMEQLNKHWDSNASGQAIQKFQGIRKDFVEQRYATVDQLVSFLMHQVGANYEETETRIQSAADAFK